MLHLVLAGNLVAENALESPLGTTLDARCVLGATYGHLMHTIALASSC